jgi:hypothetical protein
MNKLIPALAIAAIAAMPLAARQHEHQADPDKKVAGGGTLPSGWKARVDGNASLNGVKMMPMGGGVHFMTGPAGIYYKPADKGTGAYEARATFTQMEPAAHPEAYGLIIGGADLEGAAQKYTYFLIRQDGKYLIKRRAGDQTPTIADWTDSAAIKKADSSGGPGALPRQRHRGRSRRHREGGRGRDCRAAHQPQPQRARRGIHGQEPVARVEPWSPDTAS